MLSLSEHEIELETDRSKNYSERLREPAFGGQYFDDCTPERGGANSRQTDGLYWPERRGADRR